MVSWTSRPGTGLIVSWRAFGIGRPSWDCSKMVLPDLPLRVLSIRTSSPPPAEPSDWTKPTRAEAAVEVG